MRKTKIVCTLGPASAKEEILTAMLRAGMDVARINLSHESHETHRAAIAAFRRARDAMQIPAALLLDTKGPEIRLGTFRGGSAMLRAGDSFTLTARRTEGDSAVASVSWPGLAGSLRPGDTVLLDDGRIRLTVTETAGTDVRCRVVTGGKITGRKGVNVPGVALSMPALSPADEEDLRFAAEVDADFVAASFVRTAGDVRALRAFLDGHGGARIRIIAKIENGQGIAHFEEILRAADGIMIARGDMGVEIDYARLPGLQKKCIRRCLEAGKTVITATQMLESMTESPTPTRAEISDVANAVFDGTSAVMLSGETAIGRDPVRVIEVMAGIARQAEGEAEAPPLAARPDNDAEDITSAICDAACTVARDIGADAILTVTESGYTARRMSKFRPRQPIVAATHDGKTYHQLALTWGVRPLRTAYQEEEEAMFRHAAARAREEGAIPAGARTVITAGHRAATALRVETV